MQRIASFILTSSILLISVGVYAQEFSGIFDEGSVKVGYDSRSCSGSLEGAIRYNSSTSCAEFCDGSDWVCPGCTAPSSCTSVGDVCTDGSQFAGFMVYNNSSCEALYVTDINQSTASEWKNGTGTNDINPDSLIDGDANHTNRSGSLSNFEAFQDCEDLSRHSQTDWYLPALEELDLLWRNKAAIDANASGNFATDDYWASTENSTTEAYILEFTEGVVSNDTSKTENKYVRCVRRD